MTLTHPLSFKKGGRTLITFASLYSGSSGNSTLIYDGSDAILIDVGKNAKQTMLTLNELDIAPEKLRAVFVTHEHSDHIAGIRVLCQRYGIPLFASGGTLEALEDKGHLKGDFPVYKISDYADVAGFHIECFHTSHDAAESMGYTVETESGRKLALATDLGIMTDEVKSSIMGSNAIILESNHDLNMLFNGPYPYPLKRRIAGDRGHLSNDVAAETAKALVENGTEHIILGHISENNNIPELAVQTTTGELMTIGAKQEKDYRLFAGKHNSIVKVEV